MIGTALKDKQNSKDLFGHISCSLTGFFWGFFNGKWKTVIEPFLPNIHCYYESGAGNTM